MRKVTKNPLKTGILFTKILLIVKYGILFFYFQINAKKSMDYYRKGYICTPNKFTVYLYFAGCSVARLSRLLWEQEAAGSNPATPTKTFPSWEGFFILKNCSLVIASRTCFGKAAFLPIVMRTITPTN